MKSDMKKIRVLVADDHALMRMGLTTLFKTDPALAVVGEAEDGQQAIDKTVELSPDVVVLDLMMPGLSGSDALLEIKRKRPGTKVIILTTFAISDVLSRALDGGADAALLKSTPNEDLLDVIHRVAAGERFISDEVKELIRSDPPLPPLSPRQQQMLEAVAKGLSNKEIAAALKLKPDSVKSYFDILFAKLGASNRTEAVAIALRKHLLKI